MTEYIIHLANLKKKEYFIYLMLVIKYHLDTINFVKKIKKQIK